MDVLSLRTLLDAGLHNSQLSRLPLIRDLSSQLNAFDNEPAALDRVADLVAAGLGAEISPGMRAAKTDRAAHRAIAALERLLSELVERGVAGGTGVTVSPGFLGFGAEDLADEVFVDRVAKLARQAESAGAALTLELADYRHTERLIGLAPRLREAAPEVGFGLAVHFYRAEEDLRRLRGLGGRIRISRGTPASDETVSYQRRVDVDLSFVRCLRLLLDSSATPVLAPSHPRLVAIARAMALRSARAPHEIGFEVAGLSSGELETLRNAGHPISVRVFYGRSPLEEVARRVAQRPRLLADFALSRIAKD